MNDSHILSEEQAEAIRNKYVTPAQQDAKAKRAADAKRKRLERSREKAAKEMEGITTKEALWRRNQSLLSNAEFDGMLEHQERVLDQVHWLHNVLAGTNLPADDQDYVSVEEGAADLFEFVKAHGVLTMELILLGAYWQQPIYAEKFQHGTDPTSIFARLGLLTALPSQSVHAFEQFIASRNTVHGPGSAQ